jgi:hypothetical protein
MKLREMNLPQEQVHLLEALQDQEILLQVDMVISFNVSLVLCK